MLPHVNAKNQEQGGLASPGKTKGKTLHTPSPGLVKATGDLAEELSQRTLKRLQPNLKAVIVSGKTPWTRRVCLQQKNAFPLGSRSQCLLQAGQLCLGQQALSRNIAVLNLWSNRKPLEGWKFTLNMVQSKEHAKGIWSVLENMGSEHPPHTLSSLPAKSRWNYHSRVVLYTCKGADGSPPTSLLLGIQGPLCSQSCRPQPQSSPRAKATALLTLAGTTADCHTVLIGSQSRTGIRLENSCRFPEIN